MAASVIGKWIMLIAVLFFINTKSRVVDGQQVPCAFFFGDSQFDNGNNNNLLTLAKVNYQPYGIDYLGGQSTGRFTNGKNIADFIAQFLGFPNPIPPWATARGSEILKGVNYASGGSGILDETGKTQVGQRFTMNQQLLNHMSTIIRILGLHRGSITRTNDYLGKCLYTIYMGSNDYLNNYLLPQFYPSSTLFTPEEFAEILIKQYTKQLTILYKLGARKIAIFGIGLVGCVPQELNSFPTNGSACVNSINAKVNLFNDKLKPLVDTLNNNLPGAKFIYLNLFSISSGDPSAAGIRVVNAPCCEVSTLTGLCIPNSVPCSNRSEYAFWDNFHTTEILNFGTASRAYTAALPTDAYPYDIQHLVQQ